MDTLDTSGFVTIEQGGAPEPAAEPAQPVGQVDTAPDNIEADVGEVEQAEPGNEEAEAPKPKKTAQERIDELTRARREAERRATEAERRLAALEQPRAETQPQGQAQADDEPNPDDFEYGETDPKYMRAVIKHGIAKGLDEAKQNMAQDVHIQAQERAWEATQESARSKFADYDEKVVEGAKNWPCTMEMAQAIRTSDAGGEVAYHLASNPAEARRIATLDPFSQIRELGKLEARLTMPATEEPKPKPTTNAPRPPETSARGAGGRFAVQPDTDDFAAFEKTYMSG